MARARGWGEGVRTFLTGYTRSNAPPQYRAGRHPPYGCGSKLNPSDRFRIDDTATGLTYMQARYYDPVIGRFLSIDPVNFSPGRPDMFNRYAYVANDPVNMVDPDGLAPQDDAERILEVVVVRAKRAAADALADWFRALLQRETRKADEETRPCHILNRAIPLQNGTEAELLIGRKYGVKATAGKAEDGKTYLGVGAGAVTGFSASVSKTLTGKNSAAEFTGLTFDLDWDDPEGITKSVNTGKGSWNPSLSVGGSASLTGVDSSDGYSQEFVGDLGVQTGKAVGATINFTTGCK